jgi:hypothetical protein
MSETSAQGRPGDPRIAQRVDPQSGRSDDPRVDPLGWPDDRARQNDRTEKDTPAPSRREETSQSLHLDP